MTGRRLMYVYYVSDYTCLTDYTVLLLEHHVPCMTCTIAYLTGVMTSVDNYNPHWPDCFVHCGN